MRVRWTEGAVRNLDEIEAFIARDKPWAAIETVLKVIDAVSGLSDHPSMGRPGRVEGTRELVVPGTPFIVPYRVRDETVEVLRVFHHSRRWPDKL